MDYTEDVLLGMSKKELWVIVKELEISGHKWTERKIDFMDAILDVQEAEEYDEEIIEAVEEEADEIVEEIEDVIEAEPEPEVVDLKAIMEEKAIRAREPVMKSLPPSRKTIQKQKNNAAPVSKGVATGRTIAHKKRIGAKHPPIPQYVDKRASGKRIRWGG